ncbi:MAG: hypothetical protein LBU09_01815, partial [Endomicrobium sp.]|nr:hypothetical protein [Endomicrobium sp.]
MKRNVCLSVLVFLFAFFAFAKAAEQVYDGTQYSAGDGDTLIFDGQSPYNDITNNINSSSTLTGTIYITGEIDSYKLIFGENLLISSHGKITVDLTQHASSVLFMSSKTIVNDGNFIITGDGSSLADGISDILFKGAGKVILDGAALDLKNTVSIEQSSLTINAGKLSSAADLLKVKYIENNDTLTLTGGTLIGELAGNGTLNVNASASDKTVFINSVL